MAKKRKTSGIGSLKSMIERTGLATKRVADEIRAIKQKKTLEKRLKQKINALTKAKAALSGLKTRKKRK